MEYDKEKLESKTDHHFFAFLARMRHIRRWGLMRNTFEENDQEHSHTVAMIAHALALIKNTRYGGTVDAGLTVQLAIYHEAAEVITGDLASPIKYHNPEIRDAFKRIEAVATKRLLTFLPGDLRPAMEALLIPNEDSEEWQIVKCADKISAYLKCVEEKAVRNSEFSLAEQKTCEAIKQIDRPEVADFMREFAPSFALPLDGLNT